MTRYRDTYAKVRLDYIKENVETLYKKTKKPMVAIIKANAYGHGYKEVASVLKDESIIQMFAVATLKEAVDLRDLGVKQDILVLGAIPLEDLDIAIKKNISLALFSFDYLNKINEMHRYDAPVKVHLSIDSGMNRIGFKTEKEFEKAMEMILNGECGAFNPLLLECLVEIQDRIKTELDGSGSVKKETYKKTIQEIERDMNINTL